MKKHLLNINEIKSVFVKLVVIFEILIGFATTAALYDIENKIPKVRDLFKETDNDVKISDIETKYFTTSHHNIFTGKILDNKIKEKRLTDKCEISGFAVGSDLVNKIATLRV